MHCPSQRLHLIQEKGCVFFFFLLHCFLLVQCISDFSIITTCLQPATVRYFSETPNPSLHSSLFAVTLGTPCWATTCPCPWAAGVSTHLRLWVHSCTSLFLPSFNPNALGSRFSSCVVFPLLITCSSFLLLTLSSPSVSLSPCMAGLAGGCVCFMLLPSLAQAVAFRTPIILSSLMTFRANFFTLLFGEFPDPAP